MKIPLWDNGINIGEAEIDYVDNIKVIASVKPLLLRMKADAKKDGVILTLGAGLRTYEEQVFLRKKNIIDKSKAEDMEYIKNAPSTAFYPVTGKPGFSNHHDGKAYDFNVTGKPDVYKWMVKNAIKYGFVRTVQPERWHFEILPGVDQFAYVPKNHETWDNLV